MNHKYIRNIALFGHFAAAIAMNTLAPLLPVLQDKLDLTIFQSSALPTAMAVAIMVSNLIMGIIIIHIGHKHALIYGIFLMMLGSILGFFSNNFVMALITYLTVGFAAGAIFTSLATIYSGIELKYQNFGFFHAAWGLGGMTSPILVTLVLNLNRDYHELYLVHIAILGLFLYLLTREKDLKNQKYSSFKFSKIVSVIKYPVVLLGILSASLYAGTEIGSFTWSLNMSVDGYGVTQKMGGYILSSFWLLFTLGRIFADSLAFKIGPIKLTTICSLLTSIILVVWLLGISPFLFPLIGLTFAPVFPVIHKYVNNKLKPEERGLYNGLCYAGTGLASTLILPIMGSLGDKSMFFAYIPVLIISIALIFILQLFKKLN